MQDNYQNNNQPTAQDPQMPIVDPVLPFIPKMGDPNTQTVRVGGVEGGAQIQVETGASRPTVEADIPLQENEKPLESYEKADVKEPRTPVPNSQPPQAQQIAAAVKQEEQKEEVKSAFQPEVIGNKIDPELYSDVDKIKENASKGDPTLARTAIMVLLARLLNKESK
jgi:hypothetical protein